MRVSKPRFYFDPELSTMYSYPYGRYKVNILFISHAAFSASRDVELLRAKRKTAEFTLGKFRFMGINLTSKLEFLHKLKVKRNLHVGELSWASSWWSIIYRKGKFGGRFNIDETFLPPFIF